MSAPQPANPPIGRVTRFRDLLYWRDPDYTYVLACDANAGIGQRPHDALEQTPFDTGFSAAKVPLMEVLASGATPLAVTNTLGGPRDAYGTRIISGIGAAIAEVDADITLTGSDETNVVTTQTSVGVTVVGRAAHNAIRLGTAQPGDVLVAVGVPKDGVVVPYTEGAPEIARVRDVQQAARLDFVHELLPVGSRGIRYEAAQLARGSRTRLQMHSPLDIDVTLSAGASTCFLVALPPQRIADLAGVLRPPVTELGHLTRP